MASMYGIRELYGGSMSVELPVELIDSSDIRQIPDHQEVFLSPTTLTSLIFEINAYVHPSTSPRPSQPQTQTPAPGTQTTTSVNADGSTTITTSTSTSVTTSVSSSNGISSHHHQSPSQPQSQPLSHASDNGTTNQQDNDISAAEFHFKDVISPPDSLVSGLPTPQPIRMLDPSLAQFPAYMLAGNINTVEPPPRNPSRPSHQSQISPPPSIASSTGSSQSHSRSPDLTSLTHQIQLLIRLPHKSTDIVVRAAVPLKEFARAGASMGSGSEAAEGMIKEELDNVRAVLARVVATLRVRDWGLFVG